MANLITALDIGSAYLKGIVAEQKKDGALSVVTVFKQPMMGMRRGIMVDVEDAAQVLREAVLDIQKISKKATRNMFVNVQNEHIRSRHSRGIAAVARADQEIQQDDVDRVLQASQAVKRPANYMVLHNIVREYFVDDIGDIQEPIGMNGNRLEVSTVMIEAFSPQVNVIVKTLEKVGAQVSGIIFTPLAVSRGVLTKRQKDLGVMLLDFGFGTTSMLVYEENKIIDAKIFPFGAGHITNDLATGLKISIDGAEKIKTTHGYAYAHNISRREIVQLADFDAMNSTEVSHRLIAEIIEARLAEILDIVNNEVKTLWKLPQLPAGVVMTGGGVHLTGIADLVRQHLKLPVHVGYPDLKGIEVINPAHEELISSSEMSGAIGLLLIGAAENAKTVSGGALLKRFMRNLMP